MTGLSLPFDLTLTIDPWLEVVLRAVAVLLAFLVLPLLVGQTEHKVMAHMQGRLGPMYAGGFHGWAQLVADGVKFVQKEDVTPVRADRWVFRLAPAVALVPYLVALAVIPLSPTVVGADVDASALFVLAVIGVGIIGTLMAGWASANKYSLLGAMRAGAQLVSYELPMVLAVASVALAAGTISLIGITAAWNPWWLLWQLPGGFVFLVAALAELQRPPFDMPVADSEIVFGAFTEYTGLRFAFFLLAEYAGIVVMSLLFAVLYLGGPAGWRTDSLGWLWTLLKGFAVAVVVIWLRVSWPRMREDQLQRLAWVWLVPIALAQLALTAIVVVVMQ
ncbi:MAG: NADH-quinone oxidoreductase subunit H [Humibacillus sp.]|nr:NADH-quinone oxidoreductase subunit H [Humibacillus sp.]MDN5776086.1 NADH-quinone oxidoreductase subunit H [Humibacillus sp.]